MKSFEEAEDSLSKVGTAILIVSHLVYDLNELVCNSQNLGQWTSWRYYRRNLLDESYESGDTGYDMVRQTHLDRDRMVRRGG